MYDGSSNRHGVPRVSIASGPRQEDDTVRILCSPLRSRPRLVVFEHAIYRESEAIIEISNGRILDGRLPRSAAKLVAEWCEIQRDALLANWALAQAQQPLLPIEPLD
jgi:hypothetical protein